MPIEISLVEPQIHLGVWEGIVNMEDVFNARTETTALAKENGYTTYVQIIDSRTLVRVPFEIRMLSKITTLDEGSVVLYVVIGGPNWVQFLTRMVNALSTQPFETVDSMEKALELARKALKEHEE